ncbi:MAG TPA: helix-turn-helix domain-containing protein, partial [Novosphingobium sp.]
FVNVDDGNFTGEMLTWQVGDLAMIRPRSTSSHVGRRPRHSAEERLILHLQLRGKSVHQQGGAQSVLEPGDFVVGSPHLPYAMDLGCHELLVVEFPHAPLAERFPGLDDMCRRRFSGATPGAQVFRDFLLSLWRQSTSGAVQDSEWERGVNQVFYDLAALAMRGGTTQPPRPAEAALRDRLLALVDARLGDPDLKTGTLAEHCNTSIRTIQTVFATMGTTPSAYILERRLQRAREQLGAAPCASITTLAYDLGFNDSAYFTRCFRQRFGVAPRGWRMANRDTDHAIALQS